MKLGDLVIEHGAFGVGRPGVAKGQGPQRFVVNIPFLNAILKRVEGDMSFLPLTNSWHVLILEHGQLVLLSSEDMKCAFYLFRLPDSWLPWLCFSMPVSRGAPVLEQVCWLPRRPRGEA